MIEKNMGLDILTILRISRAALTAKRIRSDLAQCGWGHLSVDEGNRATLETLKTLEDEGLVEFESPVDAHRITQAGKKASEEHMQLAGISFFELTYRFSRRKEAAEVAE